MQKREAPRSRRRLLVPLVLAVTTAGVVAALSSGIGCGDDKRQVDASVGDAAPDTPIV